MLIVGMLCGVEVCGAEVCGAEVCDVDGEDVGGCDGHVVMLVQLLRSRITL